MLVKHLSQPWFDFIKDGKKTIEGRLNKGDFARIRKGDEITFFNEDKGYKERLICLIINITLYNSFGEMLEFEGTKRVIPGQRYEDALSVYHKYYSEDDEDRYGVVAFEVRVIEYL